MSWYRVQNLPRVPTPSLLIYEERLLANLRLMVATAGDPQRLRPHLKTHKLPQVLHRLLHLGVTKAKCATIAEAEMAALSGVGDVLLASQPVGANAWRWGELVARFPQVTWSCLTDDLEALEQLQEVAQEAGVLFSVTLDLNVGQNRTGVTMGLAAQEIYAQMHAHANILPAGLHAYDGHVHEPDLAQRAAAAEAIATEVRAFAASLTAAGYPVSHVVMGGSPTFALHAARHWPECPLELSPGTTTLWDAGYAEKFPDLAFQTAAVLVARVVSKPTADRLCLDLGHKAVASEMPHPRVYFPDLPDAQTVLHNEEHLVITTAEASEYAVGDALYAIPRHICPTMALQSEVFVVREGTAMEAWPVVGRARRLSI